MSDAVCLSDTFIFKRLFFVSIALFIDTLDKIIF